MRWIALFPIIGSALLAAQTIPVTGVLTVHNSAYRTGKPIHVRDATVRAAQAKPVTSDADGRFGLEVVGMEPGATVRLSVDHGNLVLLDPHTVEHVVLGASEPLVIRMADPRVLDEERIKYHGIARTTIEAQYKERMDRLRDSTLSLRTRLDRIALEFGGDTVDLATAITRLVDQRKTALEGVDELTERFVRLDLDAASERLRAAFEAFAAGDIPSALRTLDAQALDREQVLAAEQRKAGAEKVLEANKAILDIRQCYGLKANVLLATMRYREAIEAMRAELLVVEQNTDVFPLPELVSTTLKLADLERVNGHTALVHGRVQKLLDLPALGESQAVPQRLNVLILLCRLQGNERNVDAATTTGRDILRLAFSTEPPAWKAAGQAHTAIAEPYRLAFQLDKAMAHLDSARTCLEKSGDQVSYALADVLHLMATVKIYQYRFSEAAELLQRCIATEETRPQPDHHRFAVLYGDLSFVYGRNGPVPQALDLQRRSLAISRRLYGPDHPSVLSVEATMANTYHSLDMSDSALVLMDHCIAGYERWYEGRSYDLAMYLENRADNHADLEMPIQAIEGARRAIHMIDRDYRFERMGRAASASVLARAYRTLGARDSAWYYLENSIDSMRAILGTERHPNLIMTHLVKADLLLDSGETEAALDLYRIQVELRSRIFGRDHWKLMALAVNMAEAHRIAGRSDSAAFYLAWAGRMVNDVSIAPSGKARYHQQCALHHEWAGAFDRALVHSDSAMVLSAACPAGTTRSLSLRASSAIHGRMLLNAGRYAEAAHRLIAMLAMPRCAGCQPSREEMRSRALLGGALLLSGRTDTARIVVEEAVRLNGDADALWFEYLLMKDERDPNQNVDALLRCWNLRRTDFNSAPHQERTTWEELQQAATMANRTNDLIGLEPLSLPR